MVNSTENIKNKKPSSPSNRFLAATLSLMVAAIVGLTVGIVFLNLPKPEPEEVAIEPASPTDATDFAYEIETKYEEDGDYLLEDAKNDFSTAIDSLEGDDKVELAIEYALFIYKNTGDLNLVHEILDPLKNILSKNTEISYYFTYVMIYEDMGDSATAAKYQNIIAEKYPESVDPYDIAKQKEIEYENSTQ